MNLQTRQLISQRLIQTMRRRRTTVFSYSSITASSLLSILIIHILLLSPSLQALNSDGVSLLSFKSSIRSDPLSLLANWNRSEDTPCSWWGVKCAQLGRRLPHDPDDFRVIGLAFPNSNLAGTVSPELGAIQHLRYLDLSNNSFNASLPDSIFNASQLQVLSLAGNFFSGEIPSNITVLRGITVVSLRRNYFSGKIPSGWLDSVEVLDLSSNMFDGTLPKDFGGGGLKSMNLSRNGLAGEIPPEFVRRIPANATIDLSFNNFTGPIPATEALWNQDEQQFAGNADLCGKPLKIPCRFPPDPTSPPAIAVKPKPRPVNAAGQEASRGMRPGAIAGIVAGDITGLALVAAVAFSVYQTKKKRRRDGAKEEEEDSSTPPHADPIPRGAFSGACPCLTKNSYSSEETSEATCSEGENGAAGSGKEAVRSGGGDDENKGSECGRGKKKESGTLVMVDGSDMELETLLRASAYVMGAAGGRSIVYKAVLGDGTALAVRRVGGEWGLGRLKEFESQVRVIAKMRHPNILPVRGFYWAVDEKLLICDYVSNGSLATVSHSRKHGSSSPYHLPLETRLKIARGVAMGLAYIHEKKHVHGNLKPSNILLTPNMDPIIGDFGLDQLFQGYYNYNHKNRPITRGSSRSFDGRPASLQETVPHPHQDTAGPACPFHAPESLPNENENGKAAKLNPKRDVYSFGMLLLQLLTGRVFSGQELSRWAAGPVDQSSRVLALADVAISDEVAGREDATLACFELGFGCASLVPQKRPSMKEVLQVLDRIEGN